MFLPQTNDHSWPAIVATCTHLIVFAHACSYYSRAATNRGAASIQTNTVNTHVDTYVHSFQFLIGLPCMSLDSNFWSFLGGGGERRRRAASHTKSNCTHVAEIAYTMLNSPHQYSKARILATEYSFLLLFGFKMFLWLQPSSALASSSWHCSCLFLTKYMQ